jgi:hypothetical protein
MNVLGIIATPGLANPTDEMKGVLKRCLTRAQARSRQQCEPTLDTKIEYISKMSEATLTAGSLREAKGVILICKPLDLNWVSGLGHKLKELDRDGAYNLRGKWFGLIICGENDPWKIEGSAQRVLYEFNTAGMTPLPQALAHLRTQESRGHLRLGVYLADMLASQSEWTGRAEQKQVA